MRLRVAILALALAVAASRGGEVTTIDGEAVKADIVSITATDVTYKVGNKQIKKAIAQILKVDFREPEKVPENKNFAQVELTDGTTVFVSEWALKEADVEMKLLSGPAVKLPVSVIGGILNNAKEEKYRTEFRNRIVNTRGKDAFVIKKIVTRIDKDTKKEIVQKDGKGNPLEQISNLPLISDIVADAKGATVKGKIRIADIEQDVEFKQKDLHGIIFKNTLPAKAKPVICRLLDTQQNVVMVSGVTAREGGGVVVTTPAGARMDFTPAQIAQLDYTRGRLDYLSALVPAKTVKTPSPFEVAKADQVEKWYVYANNNLNMTPIKVGNVAYRQGLTLVPDVEVEYQLNAQYREFSAVIGIDDETKAEGEGTLVIEGDGRTLETIPIVYKTEKGKNGEPTKPARKVHKVNLNIKGVESLKIKFKAKDELNALSLSVSLGDAKVNK